MLGALQDAGQTNWQLLSPAVKQAYEKQVSAAGTLIEKLASSSGEPPNADELKALKTSLSSTTAMVRANVKAMARFGLT